MLTISPPHHHHHQACSSGWNMLDDHNNYMISSFCGDGRLKEISSESIDAHSPNSSRTHPPSGSDHFFNGADDKTTTKTKKLNHNASERDRRKRINTLYADLRNLLPSDDHSRKLSIPATISRVLKYIPELQKEVEKLIQNKKRLISKTEEDHSSFKFKIKSINCCSVVSTVRISDEEIVIQSSMQNSEKASISEAISRLEDEGFLIINASCFESFEGRLFHNFHVQAQESGRAIDAEKLKEKVWPSI